MRRVAAALFFGALVAMASTGRSGADEVAPSLSRDVDQLLERTWRAGSAAVATDAAPGELCRRLHLDLVGRTPSSFEARAFLDDQDPARAEKLADRLLASPEHARHLAEQLTVVILSREWRRDGLQLEPFRAWLAAKLEKDTPLDELVATLLSARGSAKQNPETYFLLAADAPADLAGRTARVFLGRRIQCAQCHDHPYEPWHRSDFWSAASFFQRVRRRDVKEPLTGEMVRKKQQPRTIDWEVKEEGSDETRIPKQPGETGRPELALPRFLGSTYDLSLVRPNAPRLPSLAKELVERQRGELARALANRLFAQVFGRGVVHPVDDFSDLHPPAIAGLLERLARGLEGTGFRTRAFLRALVVTRAYNRSSTPAVPDGARSLAEEPALTLFARARHRPLPPESLLRAVVVATGSDDAARAGGDAAVKAFGARKYEMSRRLEGLLARHDEEDPHSVEESIPRALVLMNGPDLTDLCAPRKNNTTGLALEDRSLDARVERLALAAFTRRPTDAERARWVAYLEAHAKAPGQALQDLLWSMLNSTEFQYNH